MISQEQKNRKISESMCGVSKSRRHRIHLTKEYIEREKWGHSWKPHSRRKQSISQRKARNRRADFKLNIEKVRIIRKLFREGYSRKEISEIITEVSYATICRVIRGTVWS